MFWQNPNNKPKPAVTQVQITVFYHDEDGATQMIQKKANNLSEAKEVVEKLQQTYQAMIQP